MTPSDVGALVVNLLGNATGLMDALKAAERATSDSASKIEDMAKRVEGFMDSAQEAVIGIAGVLASVWAGTKLKQWFDAFSEAEEVAIRLNATLGANGRGVRAVSSEYAGWATEIERVTRLDDDAVLSLVSMAEAFGVTGEAAKKAVKDAIALSAAANTSAETALRVTANLAQGNLERAMLSSKFIAPLRGVRDEAEFLAKAQKLVNAGWEAEAALTQSAAGQLRQLGNAWGNLSEDLGEFVAFVVGPLAAGLREIVELIRELPSWIKAVIVAFTALSAATFAWWAIKKIILAAGIGAAFASWAGYIGMAASAMGTFKTVVLGVVTALGALALGFVAVVAAFEGIQALAGLNQVREDAEKTTAALQAYQRWWLSNRAKQHEAQLAGVTGIVNPFARAAAAEAQIKALEEVIRERAEALRKAEEVAQKLKGAWKGWFGQESGAKERAKLLGEQLTPELQHLDKLKEVLKAAHKDIDEFNAGAGMADAHVKVWEKAQKALNDEVNSTIEALEDEQINLLHGEGAAKLYRMALAGVHEDAIERIQVLTDGNKALKDQQELLKRAADTAKEYASDEEKLNARLAELNQQFLAKDSKLGWDAYANAVRKAREEVQEMNQSLERFAHVSASSAEATYRIREYMTAVRGMGKQPVAEPIAVMPRLARPGSEAGERGEVFQEWKQRQAGGGMAGPPWNLPPAEAGAIFREFIARQKEQTDWLEKIATKEGGDQLTIRTEALR